MRKIGMAALALALVGLAGTATAQGNAAVPGNAKLDCIANEASAEFKQSLMRATMADAQNATNEATHQQFLAIVETCVRRHAIADAQIEDYAIYGTASIMREWTTAELGRMKLSTLPVDIALGFGPGRPNPDVSSGMTDDQFDAIARAYAKDDVDFEKLDESSAGMIGAYVGAASLYWTTRKRLGL